MGSWAASRAACISCIHAVRQTSAPPSLPEATSAAAGLCPDPVLVAFAVLLHQPGLQLVHQETQSAAWVHSGSLVQHAGKVVLLHFCHKLLCLFG